MAKADWYNPKRHRANFVIMDSQPGNFSHWEPHLLVKRYFGAPARTYRLGWYTIMVWNRNLLKALPHDDPFGSPPVSSTTASYARPARTSAPVAAGRNRAPVAARPWPRAAARPPPSARAGAGPPSNTITAIR